MYHCNNTVEKCVTPFHGDMYLERYASQDICYTIFLICFLTKSHTMESLCMNFISLCVYLAFKVMACNFITPGGGGIHEADMIPVPSDIKHWHTKQKQLSYNSWSSRLKNECLNWDLKNFLHSTTSKIQNLLTPNSSHKLTTALLQRVTMKICTQNPTPSGIFCCTTYRSISFFMCTSLHKIIPGWTIRL